MGDFNLYYFKIKSKYINNIKLKQAFTLAEAILTMTILGVIAAIMITTLKPSRFQAEPLLNLK